MCCCYCCIMAAHYLKQSSVIRERPPFSRQLPLPTCNAETSTHFDAYWAACPCALPRESVPTNFRLPRAESLNAKTPSTQSRDITPAVSGPRAGMNQKWLHNPYLLGLSPLAQRKSKWLSNPTVSGVPMAGRKSKWLHNLYLLRRCCRAVCARCTISSMFLECSPKLYPVERPPQNHTQSPNFCTLRPLLAYQEFLIFSLMLVTGPRVLISAPCSPCKPGQP